MGIRTLILSDLHLGSHHTWLQSPEQLRPLWQEVDRVIFNGDSAELAYHPEISKGLIQDLSNMLDQDDKEHLYIAGNHDPDISTHRYLKLEQDLIFLTHGDALHPSVAPWSPHARLMVRIHDEIYQQHLREGKSPLESTLEGTRQAALHYWEMEGERYRNTGPGVSPLQLLRKPSKPMRIMLYWSRLFDQAHQFTLQHAPNARLMIFGHAHRQGIARRGACTLINTGAFSFPAKVWAVVLDGMSWKIHLVKSQQKALELGKILHEGHLQE